LRASWEPHDKNQGAAFRLNNPSHSWLGAVGLFVVVGIAYFLAARVGLVLGASHGVPIFWPAAGIAVGAFIALGPNARLPVTGAVVAATIASGILIGRSLSLTITFAFFNTGEALLTAWLIERWFGRAFTLEAVAQVLGFVVASAVSEAIAASGAGIVVHFLEPTTSSAHAWRLWFASCSLGIFTVAPLLIGLGQIVRELPPRRELIEGTVGLATLAALSGFVISLPHPWATALPVALVLPVLLWISVRCRPAFAAAAMFIVALAVIWSTTFDVGQFADASVPLADRILAAQTLVLAAALLALVLAALFAERRRSEERQRVLIAELDHRVKNVLATVSAVAAHTLDASSSMAHFVAALDGRLRSMASTHELLSDRQWRGIPLAELMRSELAAYATRDNIEINGPEVMLRPEAGQAMAMVVHELVTNAAKHGALSIPSGRVSVRWHRELDGSDQFVFAWRETGGPRVEAPGKSGYGTGVVRELVPYEFGGTVDFSFAPEGVQCRLEIPFDRVSGDSRNGAGSEELHLTEWSSSALLR
jgi:two-component sensor histidine kinase/integral membrane sensor domain MASE1